MIERDIRVLFDQHLLGNKKIINYCFRQIASLEREELIITEVLNAPPERMEGSSENEHKKKLSWNKIVSKLHSLQFIWENLEMHSSILLQIAQQNIRDQNLNFINSQNYRLLSNGRSIGRLGIRQIIMAGRNFSVHFNEKKFDRNVTFVMNTLGEDFPEEFPGGVESRRPKAHRIIKLLGWVDFDMMVDDLKTIELRMSKMEFSYCAIAALFMQTHSTYEKEKFDSSIMKAFKFYYTEQGILKTEDIIRKQVWAQFLIFLNHNSSDLAVRHYNSSDFLTIKQIDEQLFGVYYKFFLFLKNKEFSDSGVFLNPFRKRVLEKNDIKGLAAPIHYNFYDYYIDEYLVGSDSGYFILTASFDVDIDSDDILQAKFNGMKNYYGGQLPEFKLVIKTRKLREKSNKNQVATYLFDFDDLPILY